MSFQSIKFFLVFSVSLGLSLSSISDYNVSWNSSSINQTASMDGMPLGNGKTVTLVWGNASTCGIDLFIRSPLAMTTDTTLLTIARVSAYLTPSPCGSYWNQTHHKYLNR